MGGKGGCYTIVDVKPDRGGMSGRVEQRLMVVGGGGNAPNLLDVNCECPLPIFIE